MVHVVIDTSILRQDPARRKASSKALEQLCRTNLVTLHLPEMVKREFLTHRIPELSASFGKVLGDLSKVKRLDLAAESELELSAMSERVAEMKGEYEDKVEAEFEEWLGVIGASQVVVAPDHTAKVLDGYFSGAPPFAKVKNRQDIPDAFILEAVRDVAAERGDVHVVAADGALSTACAEISGVVVHNSLDDFIDLDILYEGLQDTFARAFFDDIIALLEAEPRILTDPIELGLQTELYYRTVRGDAIPEIDNEANVTYVENVEDFEFGFSSASYYGNGRIVIDFECWADATLEYWMERSEFFASGRSDVSPTGESNKYNMEVSESFRLRVLGQVEISVEPDSISAVDDIPATVRDAQVSIDRIDDVEVEDRYF